MRIKLLAPLCLLLAGLVTIGANGDAPVVDISPSEAVSIETTETNVINSGTVNTNDIVLPSNPEEANSLTREEVPSDSAEASLTHDEKMGRLEQQIDNLVNLNLSQQLSQLQQQIAELRGQLQVQAHDLKQLGSQQRNFYQDLDQRVNQIKNQSQPVHPKAAPLTAAALVADGPNNSRVKEINTYQTAFASLLKKQYDTSESAFQNYLKEYPQGQYAANSHYWLGEIYLLRGAMDKAESEFKTVDQFTKSEKIPDARLKLAVVHAQTGKIAEAKNELALIKTQYPDTTAAQLANIRLQQLNTANP